MEPLALSVIIVFDLESAEFCLSFTFFGSVSSIYFAGFKPVFVDVDRNDYMASIDDYDGSDPKNQSYNADSYLWDVINMEAIMEFAKENSLLVIEDAAQVWCSLQRKTLWNVW